MTNIPEIETTVTKGYAALIGDNFDTVQECYQTVIPTELAERLTAGQLEARYKHEGQGQTFFFAGELFQIWSGGSQGNRWVIEDDDLQIHFRTEKPSWNITVRYKAAGLWEHGLDKMKERVIALLSKEVQFIGKDWCRLSRVDYAFDFYSPAYTNETHSMLLAENMLLTSGVKAGIVFTSRVIETLTIGMNRKGVQIQVYDKGKEITQVSGKTWMFDVWEREGYHPPEDLKAQNVYRFEVRFGKEFLKDRNILKIEEFREKIKELITEAIFRRRMVVPNGDSHRERWPLHPLWAAVHEAIGNCGEYIPCGRKITGRREEYKIMLDKQIMGCIRARSVLEHGHYQTEAMGKHSKGLAQEAVFDAEHNNKILKSVERYRYLDEAQ